MPDNLAADYARGQAVHFDGVPAVVLKYNAETGALEIAEYPGAVSLIGDRNSKLAPLDESAITHVFAHRIAEIRAYYGLES